MQDSDLVLGIDIGGTNTSLGFVDRGGTMVCEVSLPTEGSDGPDVFLDRLHRKIEELYLTLPLGSRLRGIGIGAPNAHAGRGTIEQAVHLNWTGTIDFVSSIRRLYDLPVCLTNDAKAAAMGEMLFGHARGMKHFIVITLGTGLGSGIVADGRLLYGASGFAGELGHTVVDPDGRKCECGKRGCLETYVSATGLVRTTLAIMAERNEPSPLREAAVREMTSKQIFESAFAGDAIALEALDRTARILGMKLADAIAHTSPQAIFLSGGLALAGDLLIKPAEKYMNEFLFRVYQGTVKLMPSALAPKTGAVVGAAALVWNELSGRQVG